LHFVWYGYEIQSLALTEVVGGGFSVYSSCSRLSER